MADPEPVEVQRARSRRAVRLLGHAFTSADSYGLVIVLLIFSYCVLVSVQGKAWPSAVVIFVQLAVVWFVFRTSQVQRAGRLMLYVFGTAAVLTAVGQLFNASDTQPSAVVPAVSAALYLIAVFTILRHIVVRPSIDLESALGAIAAYICLGMFFAFLYRTIALGQAGPFFGANGDGSEADVLFFSMTTLTTTGYGNLVPAKNPGQTFAVLEMVTGQLFLLVAVGKVISALPGRRAPTPTPSDGE
jgi:hypothetical protein